jgi:hypothetical protein
LGIDEFGMCEIQLERAFLPADPVRAFSWLFELGIILFYACNVAAAQTFKARFSELRTNLSGFAH